MTPADFASICALCGYAPRLYAQAYAEQLGRPATEDDFVECHRRYEHRQAVRRGEVEAARMVRDWQGGKCTKRLKEMGGDE